MRLRPPGSATRLAAVIVPFLLLLVLGPARPGPAQQADSVRRVGVLTFTQLSPSLQEPLRQGLRDQGYVEGQNLVIEWRAADGRDRR